MKSIYSALFILALLAASQSTFAEIYKWVDKEGNVRFSDKKPPEKNQAKKIQLKYAKGSAQESDQKVILYSAAWCGVCKSAKRYFERQGIAYQEYDIEKSVKGSTDFKRMKGRGVPIILIGDQRMNGFDQSSFEKLYKG